MCLIAASRAGIATRLGLRSVGRPSESCRPAQAVGRASWILEGLDFPTFVGDLLRAVFDANFKVKHGVTPCRSASPRGQPLVGFEARSPTGGMFRSAIVALPNCDVSICSGIGQGHTANLRDHLLEPPVDRRQLRLAKGLVRERLTGLSQASRLVDAPTMEAIGVPSITTYTEFKQQYDPLSAQKWAEVDAAWNGHRSCVGAADAALRAASPDDAGASARHARAVETCEKNRDAKLRAITASYDPLLEDLVKRARDGQARLGRMLVSWDTLDKRAGALEKVTWGPNPSSAIVASEKTAVFTVSSFAELRKVLEHDRFVTELHLVAAAREGKLELGGEQKTVAELTTELTGKAKLHVDDVMYVSGPAVGKLPTGVDKLRKVFGDGPSWPFWETVDEFLDKVTSDRFCFPPSAVVSVDEAREFGGIAERCIEEHYCLSTGGCNPYNDYFDNYNPLEWEAFLARHDPKVALGDKNSFRRYMLGLIGSRPDIATNKGLRREYYEIKPFSPPGVSAGLKKLVELALLMWYLEQPYVPGTSYIGARSIPVKGTATTLFGLSVSMNLLVFAAAPGLILYLVCIEGELVKLLEKITLAALFAYLVGRAIPALFPLGPLPVPA